MAAEVFQQQLHVPAVQRAEELDSRARGQIGAPVVLLAGLHIDADHRPDARTRRPPAAGTHAPPRGPRVQNPRLLIEEAATAPLDPEGGAELLPQPQVRSPLAEGWPPHP